MRFLVYILISVFIISCQGSEKPIKIKSEKKKEVDTLLVMPVSTEMAIMTYSRYEDPFFADTLKMEIPKTIISHQEADAMFEVDYQFKTSYPQSKLKEHEKFNKFIREKVEDYFKDHFVNAENFYGFYVNAQFDATDFELNKDYVGVLFTEQDYYDGAAHYNHGYQSFHFDFKRNKEIKLTDVLIFKNGEAQKFSDAFNPDPTTTIHEIMLEGEDFSADRPFITNYGELYMYFSDGEKSPSMERLIIPYSKFKGYVNPEYKYLFED
jgi:hypothetical protein